jgi:undecaprenyl-diphosphatase
MSFEEIIKYIILGIIQGIAEILPISSSGHLVIIQSLFGINGENPALEVFLHFASLIAVIFFLRKQLKRIAVGTYKYIFKKDKDYKYPFYYFIYLLASTCVTAVFGLVLDPYMDKIMQPFIVGCMLIINGVILLSISKVETTKDITELNFKDALLIGLAQGIGVIPGISRSGVTISGGVLRKYRKDDMAEYSFILFIPATVGAVLLSIDELALVNSAEWLGYGLSFIFALVFTYLSLNLFLKIIRKKKLDYFAYYCFIVGIVVLIKELLF